MTERWEKRKLSSELTAVPTTIDHTPSATTLSTSSSSASVESFREEDCALLSFIALCASQSAVARSAEVVLDAVLNPPREGTPAPSPNTGNSATTLGYPEVRVILHLHYLRCALRDLQECSTPARRHFVTVLEKHFAELASVLPDPLFLAITAVLKDLLAEKGNDEDALSKKWCHVLEVQLLRIVEMTQVELLRATKLLTVRASVLTLRFHHDIPYL